MKRTMASLAMLLMVGCGTTSVDPIAAGPPVTTSFPPGVYAGDCTLHLLQWENGLQTRDNTLAQPETATIDENGLPLQHDDEPLVVGLRQVWTQGEITYTVEIKNVRTDGNRLLIGFWQEMRFSSGTYFNGDGETVYEFAPPDTLNVTETWNAAGRYANNGNPGGAQYTYTATLIK
ncbi:MAG: hypothetical protein PHQ53_13105 [Candidatus Krumholzibacteria bacterium]|nr:hypothetical protein [Candidatus Krumholzibacteria bacterium]